MTRAAAVLAVSDHTGWAHILCVSAHDGRPVVIARRRIALIEPGLPTQPYEHDTRAMRPEDADALVARVRASVARTSALAIERLVQELSSECSVTALTIRRPPFDKLPRTVAEVHASYPLLCSADGVLYNLEVRKAAKGAGLAVDGYDRGDEHRRAAAALEVTPDAVEEFVARSGRPPGPPWTQEHRRAFAAGIAVLASHVRGLSLA